MTDEHGGNQESIRRELKEGMVERAKSCDLHFYDCAHRVSKATWSPKSRKEFITMIHSIYTAETLETYEARRQKLFDWVQHKEKRSHVKAWFNNFWHVRRSVFFYDLLRLYMSFNHANCIFKHLFASRVHIFRAFKPSHAPNTNMAEVGHSRNVTRGAKNDTLARVAEDHIVESAILRAKIERYKNLSVHGELSTCDTLLALRWN